MQNSARAHPITVVGNLWRARFLIIIPVLRGFFHALGGDFSDWAAGSWVDAVILLAMTGFAVLRWRRVLLRWDEKLLCVYSGLILTGLAAVPWEKIVRVSVADCFYLRPFRAVRLRIDTLGAGRRAADFSILLAPEPAQELLEKHAGIFSCEGGAAPGNRSILAMSLLSSNSFAGVIFIAAFVSQGGRLLGREFASEMIGALEQAARTLAFGLPPAAAAIAYALLGGWLAGFLLTFTRYKGMCVNVNGGSLQVRGGMISKRKYSVVHDKISYLDIRQSLITKLLGLYSLYTSPVGRIKRKDDISCLIPAERGAAFESLRLRLFPGVAPSPRALAPAKNGAAKFVMPAVYPCLGIILITCFVLWTVPGWGPFILFTGGMAMAPALYFLAVRIVDFHTGGIAEKGGVYTLRYSRGFYLHTVVTPRKMIVQTQLRQSIFQRAGGRCDLIIHTRAKGRALHRLKNLPVQDAGKYL